MNGVVQPVRVCHVITDLDTGGAERTVVNLILGLDRREFDSDVVTLIKPGDMAQRLADANIPITSLGMQRGRPSIFGLAALVRHLRATRPAILQTWLYHADLVGTAASYFSRSNKLVWNLRCTDMTRSTTENSIRWPVRLLALLSGRPDSVVVNSRQGARDHTALGYRPKKWVEIPNGVDLSQFRARRAERAGLRKRLGLDPSALVIGLIARFHPMKDVGTFLKAAAIFAKSQENARFVLCGYGFGPDNDELANIIDGLRLRDRTVLLGLRSNTEDIYPALDVLALSSIYGEGFPNVLCEAMACGVPCVATDIGDSAEIIGDCGVIVSPRDPAALALGWRTVVEQGPEKLGERARDRVTARFGLEQMCAQYRSLYRSLAAAP